MSFPHNYNGVKESGGFTPLPKGDYLLRITEVKEGRTKNDDPNVNVKLVVNEGQHVNRIVWHNVSFIPAGSPGAGISKHWLHAIGQPYEGAVEIEPQNWIGLIVPVTLDVGSYIDGSGVTKSKNIIKSISIQEKEKESQEEDETAF